MDKIKRLSMIIFVIVIFIELNLDTVAVGGVYQDAKPVKAAVLLFTFDNVFISEIKAELEKIQLINKDKIEFTFYDCKNNQQIQNNILDQTLQNNYDLFLVNLVDINSVDSVINKIKNNNIPVIIFNRDPKSFDAIKSYSKALLVGSDANEGGVLQGQIMVDFWNKNKDIIDINHDNKLQYVMLMGEPNNIDTIGRSRYSISTIKNSGIKVDELKSNFCYWNEEPAYKTVKELYYKFGDKIEAIISNNDDMSIGAIKALQEFGYNTGNPDKTVTVIGFDGILEAKEFIQKNYMAGTIIQNTADMANSLFLCGINLVNGDSPIKGTDYKLDDSGVKINIPYGGTLKAEF